MSQLSEWLWPDAETPEEKKLKAESRNLYLEGVKKSRVRFDKYMAPDGFYAEQADIAKAERVLEEEELGTSYATEQLSMEEILNKIRGQQKEITKKTEFAGSQTGLDFSTTVEDMSKVAQASIEDSIASAGEKASLSQTGYRTSMKGQQLGARTKELDIDVKKQDTVDEMKSQLASLLTGYHSATGEPLRLKTRNYDLLMANTADKYVPGESFRYR